MSLCGNRIGDRGFEFIATLIQDTKSIEILDISANNISNFQDTLPAIQATTTLVSLNLAANPTPENLLKHLLNIHNATGSLAKIDVGSSQVAKEDNSVKTTETSEAPLLRFKQKQAGQ